VLSYVTGLCYADRKGYIRQEGSPMATRVDRLCSAADKLTTPELRDLAARIAALIEAREQPPELPHNRNRVVVDVRHTPTATLRLELVNCGKGACKSCGGGSRPSHGPYWYAYWKEDGRTKSRYIGKELPAAYSRGA
jgi:hypothetical protein